MFIVHCPWVFKRVVGEIVDLKGVIDREADAEDGKEEEGEGGAETLLVIVFKRERVAGSLRSIFVGLCGEDIETPLFRLRLFVPKQRSNTAGQETMAKTMHLPTDFILSCMLP